MNNLPVLKACKNPAKPEKVCLRCNLCGRFAALPKPDPRPHSIPLSSSAGKEMLAVVEAAVNWHRAGDDYETAITAYYRPTGTNNRYPHKEFRTFTEARDTLYATIDAYLKRGGKDA